MPNSLSQTHSLHQQHFLMWSQFWILEKLHWSIMSAIGRIFVNCDLDIAISRKVLYWGDMCLICNNKLPKHYWLSSSTFCKRALPVHDSYSDDQQINMTIGKKTGKRIHCKRQISFRHNERLKFSAPSLSPAPIFSTTFLCCLSIMCNIYK